MWPAAQYSTVVQCSQHPKLHAVSNYWQARLQLYAKHISALGIYVYGSYLKAQACIQCMFTTAWKHVYISGSSGKCTWSAHAHHYEAGIAGPVQLPDLMHKPSFIYKYLQTWRNLTHISCISHCISKHTKAPSLSCWLSWLWSVSCSDSSTTFLCFLPCLPFGCCFLEMVDAALFALFFLPFAIGYLFLLGALLVCLQGFCCCFRKRWLMLLDSSTCSPRCLRCIMHLLQQLRQTQCLIL